VNGGTPLNVRAAFVRIISPTSKGLYVAFKYKIVEKEMEVSSK